GEDADIVEPPAGKKAQGWVQGEKPPAGFFNWLFSLLTRWIAWLADRIGDDGAGGVTVKGIKSSTTDRIAGEFERADGQMALLVSKGNVWLYDGDLTVNSGSVFADNREPTGVLTGIAGQFVGGTGVYGVGRGDSINSRGVWALIEGPLGRPLVVTPYQGEDPQHGAILIQRSRMPSNPSDGEIYRDWNSGIIRYYSETHGWIDLYDEPVWLNPIVVGASGGPAFGAGWSNFRVDNELRFYKDRGRVWFSGAVIRSSGGSNTIFTLPAGYRPPGPRFFIGRVEGDPDARITISSNGSVTVDKDGDLFVYFDDL